MSENIGVITAGGGGLRIWPQSRPGRPKPLCPFGPDGQSLLEQAIRTIAPVCDKIYVVTTEDYAANFRSALGAVGLAAETIAEPASKGTLPALALAALHLQEHHGNPTVIVWSADGQVEPPSGFRKAVLAACEVAREGPYLVCPGIPPAEANTGLGYMVCGLPVVGHPACYSGLRYHEKPSQRQAEEYLHATRRAMAAGLHPACLINVGAFVWQNSVFLDAVRQYQPRLLSALSAERGRDGYAQLPKADVDTALLEQVRPGGRVRNVYVAGEFGFQDVGTYEGLRRVLPRDADGNTALGPVVLQEVADSVLIAEAPGRIEARHVRGLTISTSGGHALVMARAFDKIRDLVESEATTDGQKDGNAIVGSAKMIDVRQCTIQNKSGGGTLAVGGLGNMHVDFDGINLAVEPSRR